MKKLDLAAPVIVAIIGIAVISRMAVPLSETVEVSSAPTPYSDDHARVQSRGGEAEALPPTF